jgi:2-polyprenyl-3-methyl-5-hydroxy-6-metoxy-1,4-benzoquinol methylase
MLSTIAPDEIDRRWQTQFGIDVGEQFRALPKIAYWRCNATGLCWYTPGESAGTGDLYAQLQRFDWYYMADKWEFAATLDHLASGAGQRVLEVGVGAGHFLAAAASRGFSAAGVELNPVAAAHARGRGFAVYEEELGVLSARGDVQPFDAVCAFQVLEHVVDPRGFIEAMLGLLQPGGHLCLSVPNDLVMRRLDPERNDLLNQPPHHVSHWDEHVFRSLEALLPLRVERVLFEPLASYHVRWFVGRWSNALRRLNRPLGTVLMNPLTRPLLRLLLHMGLRRYVKGHTLLVVFKFNP